MGLTKRISATVAFIWLATVVADSRRVPKLRIATPLPSRLITPLPIGKAVIDSSITAPGPVPRGYLTAAGPVCM